MKKIIFVAMAIVCAYATSFAAGKTPAAATAAFSKKFPDATNVKWGKEDAHNYEAEFELKGVKYSANFSDTGEWLETESPSIFNQLPEKVQQAFSQAHKGAKVKAVAQIETSKKGTMYEVEIRKGVKTVEFYYNSDGAEVKM
jgi:hypothetical protein